MRAEVRRFLVVGVTNTAVTFAVFQLATAALGRAPLPVARVRTAAAQGAAYAVGIGMSYALNRAWTFRARAAAAGTAARAARRGERARFVVLQGALLLLSAGTLQAVVWATWWPAAAWWPAVTAGVAVLNYHAQRTWVFTARHGEQGG